MAQEAMGDFMAAIMPTPLFESKADFYRTHTPAFCLSSHCQPYTCGHGPDTEDGLSSVATVSRTRARVHGKWDSDGGP
jgi:hypothetical protein